MRATTLKPDKLKKRLQQTLKQEKLGAQRDFVQRLQDELGIEPLDCAAALLHICFPRLLPHRSKEPAPQPAAVKTSPAFKNVRYRLDVGSLHHVNKEALLTVLVEESGVDRKRINYLDIRDTYTLVDLPDGMPADIFQLLSEATIGEHRLNIKRVRSNRKRFREGKTA